MVFGSKPSEDILQKPAPPNIDQILEDLNNADRQDPIFTLNPEEVFKEDSSSEASKVYEEVTAFVSKEKQISLLQEKITAGFELVVSSQGQLKEASVEIDQKLSKIKSSRKEISVTPNRQDPDTEESAEEDLR